jgi:hypothetical protein
MSRHRSGVPDSALRLIALAGEWAIGDDVDREMKVEAATEDELRALVQVVDETPDQVWDWLAGAESSVPDPSAEYIAVTAITQAADSARVRVRRS